MKKLLKTTIKLCAFIIIANLPFLTMTQLLGIDTFLDSFNNSDSYQYLKNNKICYTGLNQGFLILEKPTHQRYSIEKGDTILYRTMGDRLLYQVVYSIQLQHGETTYYTTTVNEDDLNGPIFEYQILGKVTGIIDDNLWNALSLQIWELSIDNLNAAALFTNE
jgi:hypothetical protein